MDPVLMCIFFLLGTNLQDTLTANVLKDMKDGIVK